MTQKHPLLIGAVITACLSAFGVAAIASANNDHQRPSSSQIAFAQEVSNLMVNELVAALFTEFNETTPDNVEHGKQAISLIFNDLNRDMRLVGTFGPLQGGANDRPADRFEAIALSRALDGGEPYIGRAEGQRHLVLSALGSPDQHDALGLRDVPHEFHHGVLRAHQQPGPMGRRAGSGGTDQTVQQPLTVE